MAQTIRNPVEWVVDEVREVAGGVGQVGRSLQRTSAHLFDQPAAQSLAVSKITVTDLKDVLAKGFDDFMAYRTDIIFLILVYPTISLVLAAAAFQYELIPLLFPLASGSVILGPFVGVFLYEMSRRREINLQRHHPDSHSWSNAVSVARSRNFGAILALGGILAALYLLWLICAWGIYQSVHGPQPIQSAAYFVREVFMTDAGWLLIGLGCGVGLLFAVVAMFISVVSFPLMLDRDVGLGSAIRTSIRAVMTNPLPMVVWGIIVGAGLVIGSIPLFIGLAIVMPVLCHATWHLYRKLLPRHVPHG
jgi:uncharacterized membrane protein